MNPLNTIQPIAALALTLSASAALAQDARFTWEGELEIGVEGVYTSDDPANEFHDAYPILSLSGELDLGRGWSAFGTVVAEYAVDPFDDREFKFSDLGAYIEELGVSYERGNTTLTFGKLHPVFGSAWDNAAGFFGSSLAEDYELTEQVGAMADITTTQGGVLSLAVFFADASALSESLGENRGRNRSFDGGAGNTGKLNNVALNYAYSWGGTTAQLGGRYLSAGDGDFGDETGVVASLAHEFDSGLGLFGEVAAFNNYGGSSDDATYVTLNGVYGIGDWSLSATLARSDIENDLTTDLASIAAEYEFKNGITFGAALAFIEEDDVRSDAFGVNLLIPLGG